MEKIAQIVVDKDDSLEELLVSLGYDKRSGSPAYYEQLKTIVIIPAKKWYWYDTDIKRGYSLYETKMEITTKDTMEVAKRIEERLKEEQILEKHNRHTKHIIQYEINQFLKIK